MPLRFQSCVRMGGSLTEFSNFNRYNNFRPISKAKGVLLVVECGVVR